MTEEEIEDNLWSARKWSEQSFPNEDQNSLDQMASGTMNSENSIVEVVAKLNQLKPEEKFTYNAQTFMVLDKQKGEPCCETYIKVICLSKGNYPSYEAGEIYCLAGGLKVIWLQKTRYRDIIIQPDCCRKCGKKLIHDHLSEKFGDYCPNEWCNEYV